jgi:hypothetical protein
MKVSTKLNEFDILDLLNEYYSELRKLRYKSDYVKFKIAELEGRYNEIKRKKSRPSLSSETSPEPTESAATGGTPATRASKKPAKAKRKPYPLSEWDKMILSGIETTGRALSSKTIFNQVKEKALAAGIFQTDEKAKAKINQCLVKLTKRRKDLVKVNYKGRGYAYALPQYLDERNKLKKEHMPV